MNFVLDENVSLGVAQALREEGHTVLAISEIAGRGISDNEVWLLAQQQSDGILITRDYHFTNPTRFNPNQVGAIIYIRHGNLSSGDEISLVLNFLKHAHPENLYNHKLVTLSRRSTTIR